MLRKLVFTLTLLIAGQAWSQAPANYYADARGRSGQSLLESLCGIISTHTALTYGGVWTAYKTTDLDADGKVWDMYSTKRWTYGTEQCGNYNSIGTCYNREHSMPKSWFDDASPMYTDVHHLYPTDGKVNSQRSNFPFGECENGTYVAASGSVRALGRCGKSTYPGYNGTVFEPDDMYKGDFARTYFYMAACYYRVTSSWHSDMLAGNNYPFFASWAVDMLLKWHREDPVSDKEIDRNNAVYALQHNRNPFVDHPELAEHIWGNKKTEGWGGGTTGQAAIIKPVDGTTIDFGKTAQYNVARRSIEVKTIGVSGSIDMSTTGPFSLGGALVTASQANAGTTVTVRYEPTTLGTHTGTLTIRAGGLTSTVALRGEAVDGLPVSKATYVTSESFRANWTYIGDDFDGLYEFSVVDAHGPIAGYPTTVDAAREYYDVENLEPATIYTYYVQSAHQTSDGVMVMTAELQPFVDFLFDGELFFSTIPGEPSDVAEIFAQIDNIDSDVTVSVKAPFELSLDRSEWSSAITLDPDENRFYLRLNSSEAGTFYSPLTATAGSYVNDNITVTGIAKDRMPFYEDFETLPLPASSYSNSQYRGTAAVWNLYQVGHWPDQDRGYDSAVALRYGKASNDMCGIEMAEPKADGAGIVTFRARRWSASEAESAIAVETSTDNGESWRTAGTATIADADWKLYTVTANVAGDVRVRFRRTAGARMQLDDVSISDYTTGLADPYAERHLWDAYCRNGLVTVDVTASAGIDAGIYSVAGATIFEGHLGNGMHTFGGIAPGQFVIVSSGDFARVIMVR